jgi:tetratricopeptide (TPR) repeat protein
MGLPLSCQPCSSLVGFGRYRERSFDLSIFLIFLAALHTAMNIDSLQAGLCVETGMAYLEQGLHSRAYEQFQRALELSDSAHEAHLGLGRVAVVNEAWHSAAEHYGNYMKERPFDHRAPLELAEMYLSLSGRGQQALDYAMQAMALAPLDGRCRMAAGRAFGETGNRSEALELLARVIAENEEYAPVARIMTGQLYYDTGQLEAARDAVLPAAAAHEPDAHRLLALIYMDQMDYLRTADSIRRYLILAPSGGWADSARTLLEELSVPEVQ